MSLARSVGRSLARSFAVSLTAAASAAAVAAPVCQAATPAVAPTVVELYTSEGCSSCPPADRWLSTLKGRGDVVALAFHVDYWNRLGWVDRYATAEATARQYDLARTAGESGVYTPQVLADGRDWRIWPKLPDVANAAKAAAPAATLTREGERVTVKVAGAERGAARLSGYWAVLEDGHVSAVRAGENAGETLRHDHVVRLYRPVGAWSAGAGMTSELSVSRGVPENPRRVVFVITDAQTQRPLQAVSLAC
jgi:hypothetical protein